jgi:hypothetical protein
MRTSQRCVVVENYDWAKVLGDTLDQTIQSSGALDVLADDDILYIEKLVADIRSIVAVELAKVAHGYKARNELLAPNNVSYKIQDRAEKIQQAELSWHVTVVYREGETDGWQETYPVESYTRGCQDAQIIRQSITAPKSVTVWFGAKTHE